jgi:MFS family permease
MPELIFALMAIGLFLMPPFIAGKFATRTGRPFWKWFWIGCALPFIAFFILFFLPDKSSVNNE